MLAHFENDEKCDGVAKFELAFTRYRNNIETVGKQSKLKQMTQPLLVTDTEDVRLFSEELSIQNMTATRHED